MAQESAPISYHRGSTTGLRILVADDFAPWRSQVRSFVEGQTEWEIIFEACDGLEAVHKTVDLGPEIVLLDYSMPGLNGIEAARKIRELAPLSKVIMLSLDADSDLVNAALEAGALGWVAKAEMIKALVPAVEAAVRTCNPSIS